ncbi:MAG: bacillithiol biosynthesis deacetylase BshB1 [Planctomycetota bacterium]|nr:MAG: bacillithiol biosynthesis deacetylase BshB1 [Planctomycetota bacterium]
MSVDLIVFAPHPDDAELHIGASIARECRRGKTVVVVDCSRGEQASRGTPELRQEEALAAAHCLGIQERRNLQLPDGGISPYDPRQLQAVVSVLRHYRPHTILAMHDHARHPDHRACAELVRRACKTAAIHGYTDCDQAAHRSQRLLFYEAELPLVGRPILSQCEEVDVAAKNAALACYKSQWGETNTHAPATSIAEPAFLRWIEHRGRTWGYQAQCDYAEALITEECWAIAALFNN